MYLTASSGSLRLMVSSICFAVILKDSCGSPNRCLIGGVASDALTPLSLCTTGGLAAAVTAGFLLRRAVEADRCGLAAGRIAWR